MRYPMLVIFIFFIFSAFISTIFLLSSSLPRPLEPLDNNGRVLGIAEAADNNQGAFSPAINYPGLPHNDNIMPIRKNDATDFRLAEGRGAVIDDKTNELLFSQDKDIVAPIASISKLMTALVFLDYNPGWDKDYVIEAGEKVEGSRVYLFPGDTVKIKDLFYFSLVGSDNMATMLLVKTTGLSEEGFVAKMNEKAKYLGLFRTSFADPVGLSADNVSTAYEIAKLGIAALAIDEIGQATLTRKYDFITAEGKGKSIATTDSLLTIFPQNGILILGGKTGYTAAAGYCFVGRFKDESGHILISAVLGALSLQSRFKLTNDLVQWTFQNYLW